jgi:hypothetical protein
MIQMKRKAEPEKKKKTKKAKLNVVVVAAPDVEMTDAAPAVEPAAAEEIVEPQSSDEEDGGEPVIPPPAVVRPVPVIVPAPVIAPVEVKQAASAAPPEPNPVPHTVVGNGKSSIPWGLIIKLLLLCMAVYLFYVKVWCPVIRVLNYVSETASEGIQLASDVVSNATDATMELACNISEAVVSAVTNVTNATMELAENISESVVSAVVDVTDATIEAVQDVAEEAMDVGQRVIDDVIEAVAPPAPKRIFVFNKSRLAEAIRAMEDAKVKK